jgi:hypothetical protein
MFMTDCFLSLHIELAHFATNLGTTFSSSRSFQKQLRGHPVKGNDQNKDHAHSAWVA